MNNLDHPNQLLQFEARHVSAKGSTSKNGPTYRISLEVDKDTFDQFITADLDAAVFAVGVARVDYDNPEENEKKKKPHRPPPMPLEQQAYDLCRDNSFKEYLESTIDDCISPEAYIKARCGVEHRNEIDKNRTAAVNFGRIVSTYEAWKSENAK